MWISSIMSRPFIRFLENNYLDPNVFHPLPRRVIHEALSFQVLSLKRTSRSAYNLCYLKTVNKTLSRHWISVVKISHNDFFELSRSHYYSLRNCQKSEPQTYYIRAFLSVKRLSLRYRYFCEFWSYCTY